MVYFDSNINMHVQLRRWQLALIKDYDVFTGTPDAPTPVVEVAMTVAATAEAEALSVVANGMIPSKLQIDTANGGCDTATRVEVPTSRRVVSKKALATASMAAVDHHSSNETNGAAFISPT